MLCVPPPWPPLTRAAQPNWSLGAEFVAAFVLGRAINWNYRRHALRLGIQVDKSRQMDLAGFPIERARLEVGLLADEGIWRWNTFNYLLVAVSLLSANSILKKATLEHWFLLLFALLLALDLLMTEDLVNGLQQLLGANYLRAKRIGFTFFIGVQRVKLIFIFFDPIVPGTVFSGRWF